MKRIMHSSKLYKRRQYALKIERKRRVKAFGEGWVKFTETFRIP